MSKITEVRAKEAAVLETDLLDLRREQMNLRFQAASNQLQNTSRVREVRRQIARIKTVTTERQRAQ